MCQSRSHEISPCPAFFCLTVVSRVVCRDVCAIAAGVSLSALPRRVAACFRDEEVSGAREECAPESLDTSYRCSAQSSVYAAIRLGQVWRGVTARRQLVERMYVHMTVRLRVRLMKRTGACVVPQCPRPFPFGRLGERRSTFGAARRRAQHQFGGIAARRDGRPGAQPVLLRPVRKRGSDYARTAEKGR